ncbi:MAG: UDP-N-acetylmuramyl-tripeptide synthetase [Treponema sp.]|jgi:UDP-N-acetylmuramoyl-L-alanyl-D-glutamate--2,6-diaminopimelate ligase|nr:UDP-N-acetylmuramyl-tripeptide synthetase [Treponema sp.]
MLKLNDFFTPETAAKAGFIERQGNGNPLITGLEYDSRRIKPGDLYFALPGLHADGHAFIAGALSRGAAAVIHQAPLPVQLEKTAGPVFIRVADSRFAMSPAAAAFYGFPAEKLRLAGVTGTEGKSTTVYLIWQLLRLSGKKAGFISTVQYSSGGEAEWNSEHQTTPEAVTVHRQLAEMAAGGVEYAVIEASSHGLSKRTNRLGDVSFDAAVMTNVTHEHLEFHGTWEQYRDDKANLFRSLDRRAGRGKGPAPFGVINAADKSAPYFAAATGQKTRTFCAVLPCRAEGAPDLQLLSLTSGAGGNRYKVQAGSAVLVIEDRLPGAFNPGNVLAALLTVSGLTGKTVEELAPLVPSLEPVRGRMTRVGGGPFEVVVDYAHTPSSFEAIFPPLRSRLDSSGGRIISLFGSAGERDTKKRSEQGAIAARYSDMVILSDEDPRGEEPMAILEEIAAGVSQADLPAGTPAAPFPGAPEAGARSFHREENLFLIPDRPGAIRKAFSLARPGDLVLLLGKGHENSIIYKDHAIKYDEIAEAEKALAELSTAGSSSVPQNR